MKKNRNTRRHGRLKNSLLSIIILLVFSFIGYGVSDFIPESEKEQITYDESAFEDEVYEIEGEELALLEGTAPGNYEDDEMMPVTETEMSSASSSNEENDMEEDSELEDAEESGRLDKEGVYTSKEEVAEYIYTYGELPSNFITKKEAKELGWDSEAGNLDEVAPGKSIGGDKFGNYEGMLPIEDGRQYYECDIDFEGGYRNGKRIVYSNDGLIFYTEDHYETFVQLY